ncbi:DNA methyltransferase family protein [Jatrophihabitans fulvus]
MTIAFDRMTTSDIAKLADVEVSTVSNWRKRHDDFPDPIDDSGRPVFSGPAVRAWLKKQNPKYAAIVEQAERHGRIDGIIRGWRHVINSFFVGNGTAELDELICVFIAHLQGMRIRYTGDRHGGGTHHLVVDDLGISISLTDRQREDIETFLAEPFDVPSKELIAAAAKDLDHAARWRRTNESIAAGDNLTAFIVGLVHRDTTAVLDFACGTGALLAAVADHVPDAQLRGIEPDVLRAFVAEARLDGRPAEIIEDTVLIHDPLNGAKFDAIVSIPPHGLLVTEEMRDLTRRLPYGPVRGVADAAWPQLAVDALTPEGDALLVLPSSLAYDTRSDQMRRELVRAGAINAIVSLPANAHPSAKIATDLWVLRAPGNAARSRPVLLIDATRRDGSNPDHYDEITSVLNDWLDVGPLDRNDEARFGSDQAVKAVTVDPLDLLDASVNLSPQYWLARAEREVDPDALRGATEAAIANLLTKLARVGEVPVPALGLEDAALPMMSMRDMRSQGIIEVLRAPMRSQSRSGEETSKSLRLTVPVAEAIRQRQFTMPSNPDDSVDGETAAVRTQAGDVLVWTTHNRQVRATVCPYDGLIPAGFVQVLRCHSINPYFVALCLEAGRNAAHIVGTNVGRLQLMDIEMPLATPSQAEPVQALARLLGDIAQTAQDILEATHRVQRSLNEAIASGQLEINLNTEKS